MINHLIIVIVITDHLFDLWGENLHQGLGGQLPHRVVLDRTPGQVSVGHEGEVVDGPDECPEVLLVVGCIHHVFEVLQLGGVHSSVPLELVLTLICLSEDIRE